jgi:NADP-dependent 3-hydroxy acid dehydrogenase YdfG
MKTVIVTGASSGIGLGLAEAYLKKGFNVVANARTKERLKKAADHLGAPANFLPVAGDIGLKSTAERIIQEAVAKFGQVDILINNAGIFNAKPFADYSPEDLDNLINTNLKGFLCFPACIDSDGKTGAGAHHQYNRCYCDAAECKRTGVDPDLDQGRPEQRN